MIFIIILLLFFFNYNFLPFIFVISKPVAFFFIHRAFLHLTIEINSLRGILTGEGKKDERLSDAEVSYQKLKGKLIAY